VTGTVRGARGVKGESDSVAHAHMSEKKVRKFHQPAIRGRGDVLARAMAALNGARAGNGIGNVITHVTRQNSGAALQIGMLVADEAPKMCERDGLVPQCPVGIADTCLVGFQVQSHDLAEAGWPARDLYQLGNGQPSPAAVAGGASSRSAQENTE
jgi:hypothetical protein